MNSNCHTACACYLRASPLTSESLLAQYMVRCPLSLARMTRVTDEGSVIYRAEKTECSVNAIFAGDQPAVQICGNHSPLGIVVRLPRLDRAPPENDAVESIPSDERPL